MSISGRRDQADAAPTSAPLRLELVEDGAEGCLRVTGPLLIVDAWRIREFDLNELRSPLIIDLSGVTQLDVAGVAAISDLARRMMRRGRGVQVIVPTGAEANRLAKMTGVFELLNRHSLVAQPAA